MKGKSWPKMCIRDRSNVLGFTGTDNTGLEGLEAAYNADLMGKAGRIVTAKNGWGDELPTRCV